MFSYWSIFSHLIGRTTPGQCAPRDACFFRDCMQHAMSKEVAPPSCHFLFRSELDEHARSKVPWRKLALDKCSEDGKPLSLWEDVRYMLELKCGLHGTSKCSRGFLSGMRRVDYKELQCEWDERKRLQASDVIRPGDAIVLVRRPLPRALRMYVPPRFDPDVVAAKAKAVVAEQERALQLSVKQEELALKMTHMTEDERLLAVASGAVDAKELMPSTSAAKRDKAWVAAAAKAKMQGMQHPDEYAFKDDTWVRPVPPVDYACRACGELGAHFRVDCPRDTETVALAEQELGMTVRVDTAVDKIQLSHGIPKMFLKRINMGGSGGGSSNGSNGGGGVSGNGGGSGGAAKTDAEHVTKEALTTREGEIVVDVRSTFAKPVITVEAESVLEWLESHRAHTVPRDVDDEEDVWFDFEPYLEAHDVLYGQQLEKVYAEVPHLRRKLQSMCTHWLRGICHKGVLCEYLHVYSVEGIPICKFYLQGKCLNDECSYRHILPPSAKSRHTIPCPNYVLGFCPLGPRCPHEHIRRDAPYIADFSNNEPLFNQVVAAFDAYVAQEKKEEVKARKQYSLTPAGAKRLHSAVKDTIRGKRGKH